MTSSVDYGVNSNKFPLNVNITIDDFDQITYDFLECGFSNVAIYEEKNYYDGSLEIFVRGSKS